MTFSRCSYGDIFMLQRQRSGTTGIIERTTRPVVP
jgi:hypothetical protein